jgi:hypothetical protein
VSEDLNLSCKSVQHRLATQWGYVKAEKQEDWYGQWQWQCGYERGWDKAMEKREWVGLTKTEFEEAVDGLEDLEDCWQAIEAKLKEKNT